jgi:hypothetical protein|tara:strand:+ start:142 stop:501 length:360 start_codon:yes stop_codon:yes gene_type:complete
MAQVSINVNYWKQSTGMTGQNLTEENQRKFTRVATKFEKKTGEKLSKTRAYKASREAARTIKAEYGSRIGSNSKCTFDLLLTGIDRTLDRKNHNLDMGSFGVDAITDLANLPTGRKAKA